MRRVMLFPCDISVALFSLFYKYEKVAISNSYQWKHYTTVGEMQQVKAATERVLLFIVSLQWRSNF